MDGGSSCLRESLVCCSEFQPMVLPVSSHSTLWACQILITLWTDEYKETVGKAFTQTANLRSFLQKSNCPPAVLHINAFFKKLVDTSNSGTFPTFPNSWEDLNKHTRPVSFQHSWQWNGKTAPLSHGIVSALWELVIHALHSICLSRIAVDGVDYTTEDEHQENSQVTLKTIGTEQSFIPAALAIIHSILQVAVKGEVETFIAIRPLSPLSARHNPFANYTSLGLALYSGEGHSLEIITLDHLGVHFASLPTIWEGQDALVVTLLDWSWFQ